MSRASSCVDALSLRHDFFRQTPSPRGQRNDDAALIGRVVTPGDEALSGEIWQDARQARRMDAAALAQFDDLERIHLAQRAHDAPLLIGQPALVKERAPALHHGFARPDEQHRERARRTAERETHRCARRPCADLWSGMASWPWLAWPLLCECQGIVAA